MAGTRTYDEKKKESLSIMTETVTRCDKIAEMLQCAPRPLTHTVLCLWAHQTTRAGRGERYSRTRYIEKRLRELDAERKELAAYQKLDKRRKARTRATYRRTKDGNNCVCVRARERGVGGGGGRVSRVR